MYEYHERVPSNTHLPITYIPSHPPKVSRYLALTPLEVPLCPLTLTSTGPIHTLLSTLLHAFVCQQLVALPGQPLQ